MLSDREIVKYKDQGTVIIHPFNVRNLGTNSYDVTLGEYYYKEQSPSPDNDGVLFSESSNIYNMYDKQHTDRVWGRCEKAESSIMELGTSNSRNIDPYDKVIMIAPGETILAHTNEFIGGRVNITSMMKARSSFGRNFLKVCSCAGMGDVGYFNRWTMEVTNSSRYYSIPLVVGRRLAQIVFFKTGETFDYSDAGKYQDRYL